MTDTPLKVPIDPPLQEILRLSAQLRLSTIPNSKKRATREVLEKRLTAWYEGLVPGRTVTFKQRKRRGAPQKYECYRDDFGIWWQNIADPDSLTSDYFNMVEQLHRLPRDTFNRRKVETKADLTTRMAKVIQQLHRDSLHSLESQRLREGEETMLRKPLPLACAKSIAAPVVDRSKMAVSKNRLVYGLLSYCTHLTVGQVRGIVERNEADDPEFRRRRKALKEL